MLRALHHKHDQTNKVWLYICFCQKLKYFFISPGRGDTPLPWLLPICTQFNGVFWVFVVKYKVEKSGQISRKWAIKMSNVRDGGGGQLFRKNEISFIPSPCVINERSFKTPRKCTGRGYPRLFSYFFPIFLPIFTAIPTCT